MRLWTDLPPNEATSPPGGARRLDGLALWPYDLYRQRIAEGADYHFEWGNAAIDVMQGGEKARRTMEGWLLTWPSSEAVTKDPPRLVLTMRTLVAAKEYTDIRFPMPPWWFEAYDHYTIRPPVRVV